MNFFEKLISVGIGLLICLVSVPLIIIMFKDALRY